MEARVPMSCTFSPTSLTCGDRLSRGICLSSTGIGRRSLRFGLDEQYLSWSSCSENACAEARKLRGQCLNWRHGSGGFRQQETWNGDMTPRTLSIKRPLMSLPCKIRDGPHAGGLPSPLINFFSLPPMTLSRMYNQPLQCGVGVTPPLGGSKPDLKTEDHEHQHAQVRATEKDLLEEPQRLSNTAEGVGSRAGRTGLISFYTRESASSAASTGIPSSKSQWLSLVWLLGPFTLVASVVLPPLYLRKFFGAVLEDSLVTDFVILFFTEMLFFVGAAIFLSIAHFSRLAVGGAVSKLDKAARPVYSMGYSMSAKIALGIGILLPVCCFVIVWPWTGPAAAAALAPYMIGLLAQLGFEKIILVNNSPVWPLVPITFQMYRLHQLNRAAQLVAGLLFSLKGVEATAETMAINGSLQTLLLALQVLGMLCLWSLGSFLTNQLPTTLIQHSIPSLP